MARPIRVMVVDDTAHVLRMLSAMLTLDGFEVVGEAEGGGAAVDSVQEADPDVVVMDYRMPMMDGLTAARRIRAQRPDQIIVLYTAFIDDEIERSAAEAGVSLCVGKVEGLASLEREISRLCAALF
ncbi:MAG: response regulator transcription factor [Actinobacteria bacterium]|nr:response regulator transcription factor [Actinomycetota bacterium]